jgi:hypothetical protein
VEIKTLDGQMRGKEVTTTSYHLEQHLKKERLVEASQKGTFKKRNVVRITGRGSKALEKTEKPSK